MLKFKFVEKILKNFCNFVKNIKMSNNKIFITTTLPYANSYRPHIGHLFEFLLADFITRYFKSSLPEQVIFNTGLDQNGSKILQKANELGLPVSEFLQGVSKEWKLFCENFHIKYDNFYETFTEEHNKNVTKLWNIFLKRGDIYEKEYTGKYCVGCESFKLEKDLIDSKCPDHQTVEIETVSETNFFFNLEKYKLAIAPNVSPAIIPNNKSSELLSFIKEYQEISVSRKKTDKTFGIDVPGREDQVIYVWFDALLNYIFACEQFTEWNDCIKIIQLCGPDNLRFQGQVFQAFLAAYDKKFTDKILVHGTILDKNGKKMSKTEGNVIDPIEQVEKWGLDAVRYYALVGLNTYDNSDWDEDKLITQFNSDICNDWGNLVSRVLHLIDTKLQSESLNSSEKFQDFIHQFFNYQIYPYLDEFKIKDALQKTNELVKWGNKYINDEKPWSVENPTQILSNLYYLIVKVSGIYEWVFPNRTDIPEAIKQKKKVILFSKILKAKS